MQYTKKLLPFQGMLAADRQMRRCADAIGAKYVETFDLQNMDISTAAYWYVTH